MTDTIRADALRRMIEAAAELHGFTAKDCEAHKFPYAAILAAYDGDGGPYRLDDMIQGCIDRLWGRSGPKWMATLMGDEAPATLADFYDDGDDEGGYPLPTDRERFGGRA